MAVLQEEMRKLHTFFVNGTATGASGQDHRVNGAVWGDEQRVLLISDD